MKYHSTLLLRTIAVPLAFASLGSMAFAQTTHFVTAAGGTGNFTTIQSAVTFAQSGDTVRVIDSASYIETIDFGSKELILQCLESNPAVIGSSSSGSPPAVLINQGQSRWTRVEGFGFAFPAGIGIDCSDSAPTINDNHFLLSSPLPAIVCVDGSPLIHSNTFELAVVDGNGGAINLRGDGSGITTLPIEIIGNYFYNNTASGKGGAIYADNGGSSQLGQMRIHGNHFVSNNANENGGAICIVERPVLIENNRFDDNRQTYSEVDCSSRQRFGGGAVALIDCSYGVNKLKYNNYDLNLSEARGGGVFLSNSNTRVTVDNFTSNEATCQGGGLFAGDAVFVTITDCVFSSANVSDEGGGIAIDRVASSQVKGCSISDNGARLSGAGILARDTEMILIDSLIEANGTASSGATPTKGGGVAIFGNVTYETIDNGDGTSSLVLVGPKPLVERCEIISNEANGKGAGIYAIEMLEEYTVLNCILGANVVSEDPATGYGGLGGGMYVGYSFSHVYLSNPTPDTTPFCSNTVANNVAIGTQDFPGIGGVAVAGLNDCGTDFESYLLSLSIENCIFWNNSNASGLDFVPLNPNYTPGPCSSATSNPVPTPTGTVAYSDNGPQSSPEAGVGNIAAYPIFLGGATNFRIGNISPCFDAGDNTPTVISTMDIDLEPRIGGPVIDMGADEAYLGGPSGT